MSETHFFHRRHVVERLVEARNNTLIITGLGAATYDLAAAGDHPQNFYLWGAMGGAIPMGLGLALAQPTLPIVVITGDGESLMGIGSLATVGIHNPKNLSIFVLDNSRYGETGGQHSHTAWGIDLVQIAKGCGISTAETIKNENELGAISHQIHTPATTTRFFVIPITSENDTKILPSRDGVSLKNRFRQSLGLTP